MSEEYVSMNDAVTMRPGAGASLGEIDQYELVRELGGGGFGCVYLAKDTVAGIDVAVKGLPPLVRLNKEELENIRRNFALVSRLHHPNIAAALHLQKVQRAVYDKKDDAEKLRVFQGDTLVVMQYAPGVTLSQWRKQFPDGKVPLDKALEITRQIASALDYAHKEKILHRDIKPANIMIETAGDGTITARVLDFGLAAEIRSSMSRVSREVTDTSGTRPYMASEQWLGEDQGKETDQYALAILFHELILGKVPFASAFDTGDPVIMINAVKNEVPKIPLEIPKSVRIALLKAFAKKREERFSSCTEFVDTLVGCGLRPRRRRWGWVAGIALLVAAISGGIENFVGRGFQPRRTVEAAHAECAPYQDVQPTGTADVVDAPKKLSFGGVDSAKLNPKGAQASAREFQPRRDVEAEDARKPLNERECVQLWEGGPYWAETNIGAKKPEDYGYYFWWGDTVGYKRVNDKWVASDGSGSSFSFNVRNTPTERKSVSALQSKGWITEDGVLAPKHDAAQAHWGGNWRMPTRQEFKDLRDKCAWKWTTMNGVNGYRVCGKGAYASASIFLPAVGYGSGTSLNYAGSDGNYWSSVPISGSNSAWGLDFDSVSHYVGYNYRYYGRSVRAVQGFIK